jgi:hypothetical protein
MHLSNQARLNNNFMSSTNFERLANTGSIGAKEDLEVQDVTTDEGKISILKRHTELL